MATTKTKLTKPANDTYRTRRTLDGRFLIQRFTWCAPSVCTTYQVTDTRNGLMVEEDTLRDARDYIAQVLADEADESPSPRPVRRAGLSR